MARPSTSSCCWARGRAGSVHCTTALPPPWSSPAAAAFNDIASEKGKIGGAAQKRFAAGAVLHHVTMSYDIDADKMLEVLRIGREKMSDKGTKSANKRVDPMRSQTGLTRAAILESFAASFAGRYATHPSTYSDAELSEAAHLVETKFSTAEWNHRVP